MSRTIYAFLVGIDRYDRPVPPLNGCVNDVEAFARYLQDRAGGDDGPALELKVLKDAEATRDAVVAGFREHLKRATKDDVALFYYAGHGSQEQAPPEFWHLEPDKLDETLVCYDSREPGKFDLADKELSALIEEAAAGGSHFVVILDCCHSASGTRNADERKTAVRRAPTDLRARPLESFLVGLADAQRLSARRGDGGDGSTSWPVGRHVLLAACRDEQEASEYPGEAGPRGAFSHFLGDTLRKATTHLTYRDLFARTAALVSSNVFNQTPQLEAGNPGDLDRLFLDGAVRPSEPYYLVSRDAQGWRMHAGSVQGVPNASSDAPMTLALFSFDATPESMRDRSKALAEAKVVEVGPTSSRVEIQGSVPDGADSFKAVPTSLPLPALAVGFEGEAQGVAAAREALAKAGPNGRPSLYVREARGGDPAEYRLIARENQFIVARAADDRPIIGQLDGYDAATAQRAIERLEHIARWTATSRLANPAGTIRLDADPEIQMTIIANGQELTDKEIRLTYEFRDGAWVRPEFLVRLNNKGDRRLYAALIDLTESFRISAALQEGGSIALDPGQEAWAYRKRPIPAVVPDELWRQGVIELRDVLKLIVCTAEFDARLLEQQALDLPRLAPAASRSAGVPGGLERLMQRVQTRDLGDEDGSSRIDDWGATQVVFTTVRPLASAQVPTGGSAPVKLAGGVTLRPHPALTAKARLTAAPTASRDLGNFALPRMLRDDPSTSQPFVVASTRSGSPGLSVLELTDVGSPESVTPHEPLRLDAPTKLEEGEHVLPVGFDGEFFLPLGWAARSGGGTEIVIERLPGLHEGAMLPESARRSLTGSIKIFFQKVVCGVLGREFEYPILAAAEVDESGGDERVVYEKDPEKIKARVASSKRIVLLVHGITGDTLEMRRGLRRAKVGADRKPLDSTYDLVLTLDYENLNTPIEDVARALKQRLEAVGLGPDHGKEFTIAAHSMGGLVSRWFIEREGGNRIANRLIMLGTPNGGSPWSDVHDWALGMIAVGLNGLATVAWPASILGGLVASIERIDVNLDQMQPGSAFLKELSQSADPGVPYLMLAGDTALAPAGLKIDKEGLSPARRLLARLLSKPVLHSVADVLFSDVPNDVAVSVASMKTVPGPWDPVYDVRPVSCDHMSYFQHPAGLKALAEVLGPA
jgi:hypothetical protein